MLTYEENRFKKFDASIIIAMLILFVIGIFNLKSATRVEIETREAGLYKQQMVFMGIGLLIIIASFFFHYKILERLAYIIWFINTLFIAILFYKGSTHLGATRWLQLGKINFQPSEVMKISLVFALAKYFSQSRKLGNHGLKDLIVPLIITGIPAMLTILQPDLGTGGMMFLIFLSMALFIGVNTKLIMTVLLIALPSGILVYNFGLKDYQRNRIITFLNPAHDPHGAGYNTIQSMIAVGSGKLTGKGYRNGTQSSLNFLPEQHTDFIFSVFNEEWGFIGSIVLISCYAFLLFCCLRTAGNTNDKFGSLLAVGITSIFFWHIGINLLMVIGLAPIVGIPLPFMSYGGSSLILSVVCVALISNIANKKFMF